MTITPRVSTVLVLADRIARRHGHDFVGAEHLLLALLEEGDNVASQVLTAIGAASPARAGTEKVLRGYPPSGAPRPSVAASPPPLRLTVPLRNPSPLSG